MTIKDLPDNYPWFPDSGRYPMGDSGELAARLNSAVVFDRRGEVIYVDNMSHGLAPYTVLTSGVGAGARVVTASSLVSGYAIRLTGGSNFDECANITKYLSVPDVNKWGLETAVSFIDAFASFRASLFYYTGAVAYHMGVIIDDDANEIQIDTEGVGYTKIADLPASVLAGDLYHNIKIVGDMRTGFYDRLIVNYVEYDLSEYQIETYGAPIVQSQAVQLQLTSDTGDNDECDIGRVIVTSGEP